MGAWQDRNGKLVGTFNKEKALNCEDFADGSFAARVMRRGYWNVLRLIVGEDQRPDNAAAVLRVLPPRPSLPCTLLLQPRTRA